MCVKLNVYAKLTMQQQRTENKRTTAKTPD